MHKNQKVAWYLIALLLAAFLAMYQWRHKISYFSQQDNTPVFNQCENVYVKKTPFGCKKGELIYIDVDVADKYCTDQVFVRNKKAVYCEYNGNRDDRDDDAPMQFTPRSDNN